MMSSSLRLNGKNLARNYQTKFRLRCQHCHKIAKTRHLDHDVVCPSCGNYAKKFYQETKEVKTYDKSNKIELTTYIVKYPEIPAEVVLP